MAHRLRTICDSDQILVLKGGQVAEMGSHRELLDRDGIYAELWNGEYLQCCVFGLLIANSIIAQELSMAQDLELERNQGEDTET